MKQRITKYIFVLTLYSIAIYYVTMSHAYEGIILILFTTIGMVIIESRQVDRYLDAALRRMFVCIDFETVEEINSDLAKHIIIPPLRKVACYSLDAGLCYFRGDFDLVLDIEMPKIKMHKLSVKWIRYFKMAAYYERYHLLTKAQQDDLSKLSKRKSNMLSLEQVMIMLLEIKAKDMSKEVLMNIRSMDHNNLQYAEINWRLAQYEKKITRKEYYLKSAANLAPNTFFAHE